MAVPVIWVQGEGGFGVGVGIGIGIGVGGRMWGAGIKGTASVPTKPVYTRYVRHRNGLGDTSTSRHSAVDGYTSPTPKKSKKQAKLVKQL